MNNYTLMHGNTPVIPCVLDNNKIVMTYLPINPEHLPVSITELNDWWLGRGIPSWRKDLRLFLDNIHVDCETDLIMVNYGASLADYYWMKPDNCEVRYCDIDPRLHKYNARQYYDAIVFDREQNGFVDYNQPSNVTDGMLPKLWINNFLVKGSYGGYNQEPANEWLVSEICKRLNIEFVQYAVKVINEKPYSVCSNFLGPDEEIVPAWSIFFSEKKPNHISDLEHYISICEKHHVQGVRECLNDLFMVDFLVMNTDRHLKNFGIIRNAKTLEWLKCIPVFDTGQAMCCEYPVSEMCFRDGKGKFFTNTDKKFSSYNKFVDFSHYDFDALDALPDLWSGALNDCGVDDVRIRYLVNGLKIRIKLAKALS